MICFRITVDVWIKVFISCWCPSPVERVKWQHEVGGVMPDLFKFIQALIQACQQIFLQEKKMKKDRETRTCQSRGIAASKNMKHQNSWNVRQVSEDFTSCKGSKVIEIWVHMRREAHRQAKRSDLCAEAGLCLYFCCCRVWGKLAPAGFSFPRACCSLLLLIIHVRLSPASCRVQCWDPSLWGQVSWSLNSRKARVTHTQNLHAML